VVHLPRLVSRQRRLTNHCRIGVRPPIDPVLMFKILVIQAANNLSDECAEFLINDRLSFMRFLGLGLEDRVLDARTIWLFREKS
jgi:hypothetical protein